MDPLFAATLGGAVGLVIGVAAVVAARWSERSLATEVHDRAPAVPKGVGDVLAVLRSVAVVLDPRDAVVNTSAAAVSYGLVRHGELVHTELRQLARQVRRDGEIREAELDLARGPNTAAASVMGVRVAPLGAAHVLILAEDRTHARRVEEVRRDFVANVSHELKTPVGGISLLAEAVLDAKDDPEAVERFASRIQVESTRLTRLVKEIVELSRLQVADTLHEPELVDVRTVVSEALDRVRIPADSRHTKVTSLMTGEARVFGDAELLVTAVANLLTNAVNYSPDATTVVASVRVSGDHVLIAVTDQGSGIPEAAQDRIFERFYRVDPARSRATGGTGLGLAIVKHICSTHGGDVTVWSKVGHGSTFTMRLPLAGEHPSTSQPLTPTQVTEGIG